MRCALPGLRLADWLRWVRSPATLILIAVCVGGSLLPIGSMASVHAHVYDSPATSTTPPANVRGAAHAHDASDRVRRADTRGAARILATRGADDAVGGASKLLGPGTSFGSKVERQLPSRGWTKRLVQSTIDDPVRTVPWRDTRNLRGGGRVDDPATGYYGRRGGYVVRNNRTGDIVQVSNRTRPGWRAPWDP